MFKFLGVIAASALVLASCATLKVTSDYDHSKDFTSMKTFAMHRNTVDSPTVSELNQDRIVNAVRKALVVKGYTEVSANPDFLVNLNTVVKDQKSVSANTDFYGYGGFYRPYGYWGGGPGMVSANTTFNVDEYQNGSLIVDIVDARTQKLFWQGVGNSDIDSSLTKDPDKSISNAVNQILASFPSVGAQPVVKRQ